MYVILKLTIVKLVLLTCEFSEAPELAGCRCLDASCEWWVSTLLPKVQ
jgi:hypothetical protein